MNGSSGMEANSIGKSGDRVPILVYPSTNTPSLGNLSSVDSTASTRKREGVS